MKTLSPTGKEVKAIAINEISIRREKYQASKLQIIIDDEVRMEELVCDGVIVSSFCRKYRLQLFCIWSYHTFG